MKQHLRRRNLIVATVVVAIAIVGSVVYVRANQTTTRYVTGKAAYGTVTQTMAMSGNLVAITESDLSFAASGQVQSVSVQPGLVVHTGDVVAQLDPAALQATLSGAQAGVSSAQAKFSLDLAGPTAQSLASAQGALATAQQAVNTAQTNLADTQAANQQAVAAAQAADDAAHADGTLAADQTTLAADRTTLGLDQTKQTTDCTANAAGSACQTDNVNVGKDQAAVAKDVASVGRDQAAITAADNALAAARVKAQQSNDQAQSQLGTAQQQQGNAQASLTATQSGTTAQQLQMDQAQIQIAQVGVDNAQRALGQATLRAPADGTVTQVNLKVGQSVSAGGGVSSGTSAAATSSSTSTAAVVILDLHAYQVTGTVSDALIGQVSIGQSVQVTPAGSPQALLGRVSQISPAATVTSGVASFGVTVTVDEANSSEKPGVSASVNIVVNQVVHVLTVPTSAVRTAAGGSTVQVLTGGKPQAMSVQVGASDPFRTQVLSGLKAGDDVVIATVSSQVPATGAGAGNPLGGGGGRGGAGGAGGAGRGGGG